MNEEKEWITEDDRLIISDYIKNMTLEELQEARDNLYQQLLEEKENI